MTSKKKSSVNKNLGRVYDNYAGMGQELQFLNAVFAFLNKKSSYLAKPGVSKQVLQIVHHHIDAAKKKEIKEQKLNPKKSKKSKKKQPTSNQNRNETSPKTERPQAPAAETQTVSATSTSTSDDNKEIDTPAMNVEERVEIDEDTVAPVGNGGTTEKYVWTQTLSSVDIMIDIDSQLRGKQLNIQIKKKRLFVGVRGQPTPIIDGDFHEPVDTAESSWVLDTEYGKSTKTLCISLQKIAGMNWWSRVIVGDPEIDTKLIQPENSKLQDLDPETRQTVEQMMFDQRQKMKGLPTSKELQQNTILEKFKAQHPEMDFSNCKMSGFPGQ